MAPALLILTDFFRAADQALDYATNLVPTAVATTALPRRVLLALDGEAFTLGKYPAWPATYSTRWARS